MTTKTAYLLGGGVPAETWYDARTAATMEDAGRNGLL